MRFRLAPLVSVFAVSLLLVSSLAPLALHDFGNIGFSLWNRGGDGTDGYEDAELGAGPISNFTNTDYFKISTATELSWVGDGKTHNYNENGTSNIWSPDANYYLANDIIFGSQDINGNPNVNFSLSRSGSGLTLTFSGTTVESVVLCRLWENNSGPGRFTHNFDSGSQTCTFVAASGASPVVPNSSYTLILRVTTVTGESIGYYNHTLTVATSSVTPSTGSFNNGNFTSLPAFYGVFDGNGFVINGMHTQNGLFSSVADVGQVVNLGVVNGSSTSVWMGGAGGIAGGSSYSTFINCYNTSSVTALGGSMTMAGGISSNLYGTFINCYNTGSVTVGGYSTGGDVNEAYASGIGSGTVINCYNTGSVSASMPGATAAQMVGGICAYSTGLIANCYNTGAISGSDAESRGGIVGTGYYAKIVNCYTSTGALVGTRPSHNFTIDEGVSNPARKTNPNQASGVKTATEMRPTLANAQAANGGNSVYYTGTTTLTNGTVVPGWDFTNVWYTEGTSTYPTLRFTNHGVTATGANIVGTAPVTAPHGSYDIPIKIVPAAGHLVFSVSLVRMGGVTMTSGTDYTYANGTVTIKKPVTGAIEITANATPSITLTRGTINGSGSIQYSVNGTDWTTLYNTTPVVVPSGTLVRSVPVANWALSQWTGTASGNAAQLTLTSNSIIGADFGPAPGYVSLARGTINGNGNVQYTLDGGINWYNLSTSTTIVPSGTPVRVLPTPGWTFSQWTGGASGSATQFAATSSMILGADFMPVWEFFTLTRGAVYGYGTIQYSINGTSWTALPATPVSVPYGTLVRITPASGWTFSQWTGSASGNEAQLTVTSNMTLGANLTSNTSGYLSLTLGTINGIGSVQYSTNSGTTWANLTGSVAVPSGTLVRTNITTANWVFSQWTGSASGSAAQLTVTNNMIVGADFVPASGYFSLTRGTMTGLGNVQYSINNGVSWTTLSTTTILVQTGTLLRTTPTTNWTFSQWTGSASGNAAQLTVTSNMTIGATFVPTAAGSFSLTLGTINGSGSIQYFNGTTWANLTGSVAVPSGTQIRTTPTSGWVFWQWTGSGSGNAAELTVTSNMTIGADFGINYKLTVNAPNVTHNASTGASPLYALMFTLTPNTGYNLPASITVTANGSPVASGNYAYNSSTGAFSLPAAYITGDVVIMAPGALKNYNVTLTLANLTSSIPSTVDHGVTLNGTISADTGYDLPATVTVTVSGSTVTPGNYTYDSSTGAFSLPGTYVTGDVVITASGVPVYGVTKSLTSLTSSIPSTVNHGVTLNGTISADTGYGLPASITVTVSGSTVDAENYTYTSSTGEFSLPGTYVTGNIVIMASGVLNNYTVTTILTHLTSDISDNIDHGVTLNGTISADTGYGLPASITVTVSGSTVDAENYTYTSSTGAFSLPGTYVTGNIVIMASGVLNNYTVTTILTDLTSDIPDNIDHGVTLSGTISADTGYGLPASITVTVNGTSPASYTYDRSTGAFSLSGTYVTGNVVITASGVLNNYNVTTILTGLTSDISANIDHGETLSGTISANTGYDLPSSITVSVNGSTVDAENYTYTSSTGAFSLPGAYVTGDIIITAPGDLKSYPVTNDVTYTTPASPHDAFHGMVYDLTIEPDPGYDLPADITIHIGGTGLTRDEHYTYDPDTGLISINTGSVTGAVTISGDATPNGDATYWYTVTFDPDNGEPVWDVYLWRSPEEPVGQPADPAKDTFIFDGWFDNTTEWIFTDDVGSNLVLTAMWSHDTTFWWVVTFDPDNGEPVWKDHVLKSPTGSVARPLDPVKSTFIFGEWFNGGAVWDFNNDVTEDLTLTAHWAHDPADWYKVTFDPDNGESTWDVFVLKMPASSVGKPADPVWATYNFEGWFNGTAKWTFTDNVTSDLTLTAMWSHDAAFWWIVTFDPDNGEPMWNAYVLMSSAGPVTRPLNPAKATYIFSGWFDDATEWVFADDVTSNLTLKAKWTYDPADWYTVTFDPNNGGSTWDVFVPIAPAEAVGKPADPVLATYNFTGWFNGAAEWIFIDNVTSNMTLTAKWSHDPADWYKVTFNPDNGNSTWDAYVLKSPAGSVEMPVDPSKSTYVFDGWFKDGVAWDFNDPIESNITLTAHWSHDPADWHKITFDPDNGGSTWDVFVLRTPAGPVEMPAVPMKNTFVFDGWFNGAAEWIFTDNVITNMTLTAMWSHDAAFWWVVTFDPDNGEPMWNAYVLMSSAGPVARPLDPVKSAFIFDEWFKDGTLWDFDADVTSNLTLTARWTHDPADWHTVTFNPNNGGSTWDVFVPITPAGSVGQPADPVLATYKFEGWFNGTAKWTFTDNVTSDLILTAMWSHDAAFWWVVTFDPDNGEPMWNAYVLMSSAGPVTRPLDPVKDKFVFVEWFSGTTEWVFTDNVTSNLTLKAKWVHDPADWYTVTFNPNNGGSTWDVFVPKTPAGPVGIPADPVLATYKFEGWFSGTVKWTFTDNITSDLILTAKWSHDPADWWIVTFDPDNGEPAWEVFVPQTPAGTVARPTDPVKSTFVFDEWLKDGTVWNFGGNVTSNMTLKARWAHDPADWYMVTFNTDGGSPTPAPQYVLKSDPYVLSPVSPTKTAYNIIGWTDGTKIWNFGTDMVVSNMTLTAVWVPDETPANWYKVTFNTDGGSAAPAPQYFLISGTNFLISEPSEPTKDKFMFAGWSNGTKIWNFGTDKVTGDMTLTALWLHDPVYWYTVEVTGTNVIKTTTSVPHGQSSLNIAITPAARYTLDAAVSVKMGALILQRDRDYTYAGGTVTFSIPISDNVIIEASATHGGFIITGMVTDRDGTPLNGVRLTYTGGTGISATTGPDGVYSFHVPYGSYVTITSVALEGYNLHPLSQVPFYLGNVLSDKSGVNFSMAGKSGAVPEVVEHGKIEWFNGLRWVVLEGELELASGSVIYLRAVADAGYKFTGWTGGADGTNPMLMLTIDGTSKNIKATFEVI